jgi:YHS domain-containing protein
MQRLFLTIGTILSLGIAMFAAGCGKSNTAATTPSKTSKPSQSAAEKGGQDAEITKATAEMPAEDRTLALKQKVCPVSGEALGTMGAPLKMDVNGHTVFLCCEGCKDKLLASPDEYLAKINK